MAKFGAFNNKKDIKKGVKPHVVSGSDGGEKDEKSGNPVIVTTAAKDSQVSDGDDTVQKSSFELTDMFIKQLRVSDSDPLLDLGVIDTAGSRIAGTYSMNHLSLVSAITSLPIPAEFRPGEFTYASLSISDKPDGKCDRYFVMMTLGCVEGSAVGLRVVDGTEPPFLYSAGISVRQYHDFDDKPVTFQVPNDFIARECAKLPQGVFEADGWDRIASVLAVGLHRNADQFHIVLYNALSRLLIEAQGINEQLGRKNNSL